MFNLNFVKFPIFGIIINYYPLFNIINASIQLITLKNNILQAIGSCSSEFMEKMNFNKMVILRKFWYIFIKNAINLNFNNIQLVKLKYCFY